MARERSGFIVTQVWGISIGTVILIITTPSAYSIEHLPKALSDALYSFVVESALFVNRTLGYGMGHGGPYREDPGNPSKNDVKWVNDYHPYCDSL
jgi:hypothetical protein